MKVGIIVHSYTGNTLSVAERLKEKLLEGGHLVSLERVTAVNEDPSASGQVQLKSIPEINGYDVLIFGAPVRAFSLSPVMKAYLAQISSLKGKRIGCFVTEYFPFPWMGGNQAIKMMIQACEAKDGTVSTTGIVNWSRRIREKQVMGLMESLSQI